MKIIKNISVNLKMILSNYGLYICMAFTIILCSGTGIYTDNMTSYEYSIIKSLIEFNREFMLSSTDFCSINVALRASNGWLSMFIPIISAFAFIPFVCDECESQAIRNTIFRSSKFSFYTSKFLTTCISGGIAVMLGYIIFTGLVYTLFPNINEYAIELQNMYKEILSYTYPNVANNGYIGVLLIKYAEMFIYGAISAVPAITLTCITKNKYLVMCIPFFVKYAVTQSCIKLMAQAYSDFENINEKLGRFTNIIAPDSILNLFELSDKKLILLYNGGLIVIAFIFYIIVQKRRLDCGE